MPVFLANIPATWETETARNLYLDELRRLGKWLTVLGGTAPTGPQLVSVLCRYEDARAALLAHADCMPAKQFSRAILAVRSGSLAAQALIPPGPAMAASPGDSRRSAGSAGLRFV